MKKRFLVTLLILMMIMTIVFVGCDDKKNENETIEITYDLGDYAPNQTVEYDGELKCPTPEIKGYSLEGWYLDAAFSEEVDEDYEVTESIILYAKWVPVGPFNLTLKFGDREEKSTYEYGTELELPSDWDGGVNTEFLGWYDNEECQGKALFKLEAGTHGDKVLYARFGQMGPYNLSLESLFIKDSGTDITQYEYGKEVTLPTDWKIEGLIFSGWYDNIFLQGEPVTKIEAGTKGDLAFYAKWDFGLFELKYESNGGTPVESDALLYKNPLTKPQDPTKEGVKFGGWYYDKELTKPVDFENDIMPGHSITLYAEWLELYGVQYIDSDTGQELFVDKTDLLYYTPVNYSEQFKVDYYVEGYYFDPELKQECTSEFRLDKPTNLYVKWQHIGWWNAKFNGDGTKENPYILSKKLDYTNFADYLFYNDIKVTIDENEKITSGGVYFKDCNGINDEKILGELLYRINTYASVPFILEKVDQDIYRVGVHPDNQLEHFEQYGNVTPFYHYENILLNNYKKVRTDEFDDFKYKKLNLEKKDVRTSNELYYVLQCGYEPVVEVGSEAEVIMNEAKKVLIDVCDDSLSDYDKVFNIYMWLVNNVIYDHYSIDNKATELAGARVDVFQPEGVFLSHEAVCDGISKAFVILARIEGIPAIRQTSENHAWNKVYVKADQDENQPTWFNVDATWGRSNINDISYITTTNVEQFLFTDAELKESGRTADNFTEFEAIDEHTDFYNKHFVQAGDKKVDMNIQDEIESKDLFTYVHNLINSNGMKEGDQFCFQIVVEEAFLKQNPQLGLLFRNIFNDLNAQSDTDLDIDPTQLIIYKLDDSLMFLCRVA